MATKHASAGEVVDLATWASDVSQEHSKTIAKLKQIELARIVLKQGKQWDAHQVSGPVVIHCLSGFVRCDAMGGSKQLAPGQLLYLNEAECHAVAGIEDSVVLLTIVFPNASSS